MYYGYILFTDVTRKSNYKLFVVEEIVKMICLGLSCRNEIYRSRTVREVRSSMCLIEKNNPKLKDTTYKSYVRPLKSRAIRKYTTNTEGTRNAKIRLFGSALRRAKRRRNILMCVRDKTRDNDVRKCMTRRNAVIRIRFSRH